jgi:hypothetical protein
LSAAIAANFAILMSEFEACTAHDATCGAWIQSGKGTLMKRYALAAALALCLGSTAQAAAIELVSSNAGQQAQPVRNLSVTSRNSIVTPPANMSELPEPEVFAMMLVGLILIGYRASRDSSEKFK